MSKYRAFRPRIGNGRAHRLRRVWLDPRAPGVFYGGCPGCVIDATGRAPIGYCGPECLRRRTRLDDDRSAGDQLGLRGRRSA